MCQNSRSPVPILSSHNVFMQSHSRVHNVADDGKNDKAFTAVVAPESSCSTMVGNASTMAERKSAEPKQNLQMRTFF
ncbi:hypothetical protein JTE90_001164 [Oedothorax gibbosus]|uniref:Uncharacterized protein n=1 Tax=Oedothorax gibbosus TaxID=931172 RepID=A0AAV6VJR3_9ARAC|nr:hypothetical protein JTE90_001164 [Oedothorax gibbosus]